MYTLSNVSIGLKIYPLQIVQMIKDQLRLVASMYILPIYQCFETKRIKSAYMLGDKAGGVCM